MKRSEKQQLTRWHSSCVGPSCVLLLSWILSKLCGLCLTQLNATRPFLSKRVSGVCLKSFIDFLFLFPSPVLYEMWLLPRVVSACSRQSFFYHLTRVVCFYRKTIFYAIFHFFQRERVRPAGEALQNGL